MDEIEAALVTTDELISIRKAALEKALAKSGADAAGSAKKHPVATHKSALNVLRRARRVLLAYRKAKSKLKLSNSSS